MHSEQRLLQTFQSRSRRLATPVARRSLPVGSFEPSGLLNRGEALARDIYIGDVQRAAKLERAVRAERVSILVTADDETASQLVRNGRDELRLLFACSADPCKVYEVTREAGLRLAP